jgi:uncharacterized coiled-coil DUF342 family protein
MDIDALINNLNTKIDELNAELYALRNERDIVVDRLRAIVADLDKEGCPR